MDVTQLTTFSNLSIHSQKLILALREGKIGDFLPLARLNEIAGRNCSPTYQGSDRGYGCMRTAIKNVLRNHGLNWAWDSGNKGLKCLDCGETINNTEGRTKRVRRMTKYNLRMLNNAKPQTPEEQRKVWAMTAQNAVVAQAITPKKLRQIEQHQGSSMAEYEAQVIKQLTSGNA